MRERGLTQRAMALGMTLLLVQIMHRVVAFYHRAGLDTGLSTGGGRLALTPCVKDVPR